MMFENVLVGVDGRVSGQDAVALASQLVEPGGEITLAHVFQGLYMPPRMVSAGLVRDDRQDAEALLASECARAGLDPKFVAVLAPTAGQGLHEEAERRGADLLVLGTCRHGIVGRAILGNNTRAAINGAPCAVAVAPLGYAEHPKPLATIGVGYDRSPESEAALVAAKELAERTHAKVRARQVVSIPYAGPIGPTGVGLDEMVDEAQRHMRSLPGVDGDAVYGLAGEELARFGGECDLLVVGSRGYGPLRRVIFGSTSVNLQGRARGPLLILTRAARRDSAEIDEGHDAVEATTR